MINVSDMDNFLENDIDETNINGPNIRNYKIGDRVEYLSDIPKIIDGIKNPYRHEIIKYIIDKKTHRIVSIADFSDIKKGDIGGFVEDYGSLSQYDDCWIYDDAKVNKCSQIFKNAKIYDNVEVTDMSAVHGNVIICDNAKLSHSSASQNAKISDNAQILKGARILGDAIICGNAIISGGHRLTEISGNMKISGNVKVYNISLDGSTEISGDEIIGDINDDE